MPREGFEGKRVPVPSVADGEPVPSSCQHPSVPARVVPLAGPSSRHVGSFVHPHPAAAPIIPPPGWRRVLPAVQRPSVGGRPNHALQRTATGVQAGSACFVLRRRCLSLSLVPLGQQLLPGGFGEGKPVPVSPVAGGAFPPNSCQQSSIPARAVPLARLSSRHTVRFVQPSPAAAPIIPPPESTSPVPASRGPL